MTRNLKVRKSWIRWALTLVLALDAVLLMVNWRTAAAPHAPQNELVRLQTQHKLLDADVRRAQKIRELLPAVQKQSDEFFRQQLRETSSGYSSIEADLGAIARDAGLHTGAITFRQKEVANRSVTEIEVVAVVEGDYPSLVKFINGLERSQNFYVLDSLSLASSTGGSLRLNLQLRTYFRS
jgi:Tfp pilus assembly protein PilO